MDVREKALKRHITRYYRPNPEAVSAAQAHAEIRVLVALYARAYEVHPEDWTAIDILVAEVQAIQDLMGLRPAPGTFTEGMGAYGAPSVVREWVAHLLPELEEG